MAPGHGLENVSVNIRMGGYHIDLLKERLLEEAKRWERIAKDGF